LEVVAKAVYPLQFSLDRLCTWCQAKFLTFEISDFTSCAHAQSNILLAKYVDKTDY